MALVDTQLRALRRLTQPFDEQWPRWQRGQVFRNMDAGLIQLQKLNLLGLLAGTENDAQR